MKFSLKLPGHGNGVFLNKDALEGNRDKELVSIGGGVIWEFWKELWRLKLQVTMYYDGESSGFMIKGLDTTFKALKFTFRLIAESLFYVHGKPGMNILTNQSSFS